MTIEKIEWDEYLEVFFSQPEAKEKWEEFCSLKSAYRGIVYPQSESFFNIHKKDGTKVYFIELRHVYFPITRDVFLYAMLYKKQYVIFGSIEECSRDGTLTIKVISKELEKDVIEIKALIKEFLLVLDAKYKKSFSLITLS